MPKWTKINLHPGPRSSITFFYFHALGYLTYEWIARNNGPISHPARCILGRCRCTPNRHCPRSLPSSPHLLWPISPVLCHHPHTIISGPLISSTIIEAVTFRKVHFSLHFMYNHFQSRSRPTNLLLSPMSSNHKKKQRRKKKQHQGNIFLKL